MEPWPGPRGFACMPNMNPTPQEQRAGDGRDLSPTQARQGAEVHRVRYVLWTSLTAAVVALGVCVAIFVI